MTMLRDKIQRLTLLCLPLGLLALASCSPADKAGSGAGSESVASLDYQELLAHAQATGEHPATLINFWATW